MSEQLIKELLQKAKLERETARRKDIEKRLNIYKDFWKTILQNEVDNQFHKETRDNIKQMIDDSSNVLKRIINEISIVYQRNATRSYFVGEKENQVYNDIMDMIPTDIIMQESNRMTNLCNESLIYIVPRNKRIEYDVVTPDQVEVFQNENDPTTADAILLTRTFVDTVGNTDIRRVYWDVFGNHKVFDEDDQELQDFGNPYKDPDNNEKTILPFVIFHKNYPRSSIWDVSGGEDLISGTIQIGVLLTYLNYLMKVNSFKQLTITGINNTDVEQPLLLDPLYVLSTKNPAGTIGTVDLNTDLKGLWDIIYNKIGALANNYGLSLDNFKLSAEAQSGYALEIKNLGLQKVIDEQRKLYRQGEGDLSWKTILINNVMQKEIGKGKIPEDGIFKIDFAETEYPESPDDIRKQWAFDIAMGARSIYDYLRFVNPDIKNDKQAEKFLGQNVEINKTVKETHGIDIDALVGQALQEGPTGSAGGGGEGLL